MTEILQQLRVMNEGGTTSSNAGELLPDIRGLRPETALALVTCRQKQAEWSHAKTQEARQAAQTAYEEAEREFAKQRKKEKPREPATNLEDAVESSAAEATDSEASALISNRLLLCSTV